LNKKFADKAEELKKAQKRDENKESQSVEHHQEASKQELLAFVEQWLGDDYSIENFINVVQECKENIEKDQELKQLFADLKKFFTKSAKDDSYVQDKERVRTDARDLIRRSRTLITEKHREEFHQLKHEIKFLNRAIQRDDTLITLRDNINDLVSTLLTDEHGNPTIKPELASDAYAFVKIILDTIKYIPLPTIEKYDQDGSFKLENIVVNCSEIVPSQIRFAACLDGGDVENNCFEIKITNIRAHLRNMKFEIDKRSGFPKFKDSGYVDADIIGSNGLSIYLAVQPVKPHEGEIKRLFKIRKATCGISKLELHMRDTKHDGLYRLLSPIINLMTRRNIEELILDQIVGALLQMDRTGAQKANEAKNKLQAAKEQIEEHPEETKQQIKDKLHEVKEDAKDKMEDVKEKAKEVKHDADKKHEEVIMMNQQDQAAKSSQYTQQYPMNL